MNAVIYPALSRYVDTLLESGRDLRDGDEETGLGWKASLFDWLVSCDYISESSLDERGPSIVKMVKSIWRDAVYKKHAAEDAAVAAPLTCV